MVTEGNSHVAVVKWRAHFGKQCLQLFIGDGLLLVENLELWQVFIVDSIPVKTILVLIVPQRIILVQSVPQDLELLCKAGVGLVESHRVVVVIGHQSVALFAAG